jgi:hypothetical protein
MSTTIRRIGSLYAENVISPSFVMSKADATQITSETTNLTFTKGVGVITLFTSTLASGISSTFTVNSALTSANSVVLCSIAGYSGTTGTPNIRVGNVASGSFTVTLTNVHSTAGLNGIVKVSVMVV